MESTIKVDDMSMALAIKLSCQNMMKHTLFLVTLLQVNEFADVKNQ